MEAIVAAPMSLSELANAYQVSNKTMKKWLYPFKGEIGEGWACSIRPGRFERFMNVMHRN